MVIFVVLAAIASGIGATYLVEAPFILLLGWVFYALEVLPRAELNWSGIGFFFAALGLLLTAGHRVLASLCARMTPPRRWRLRDTGAMLLVTLALFVTSMAVSGIGHQVGWLFRSDEPLVKSSWEHLVVRAAMHDLCWKVPRTEGRLRVEGLPLGHPEFHVVPVGVEEGHAAAVLVFPRDPEVLRKYGGLACGLRGGQEIGAPEVERVLTDLRLGAVGATPPPGG